MLATWHLAAIVVAAAGCASDVLTRRVPNTLTLGAAAGALGFWLITGGWPAAAWSLAGWSLGLLLFLPLFALRGMGGGDVKLLAALGAWVGPGLVVWLALYAAVAGGVLALVVALSHGYARQAFANAWSMVTYWRIAGMQPHPAFTVEAASAARLPYALPIAAGLGLALWLR
jgi:prepilin peptidase CpaA